MNKQPRTNLPDLLLGSSVTAAKKLIGWKLFVIERGGSKTGGTIVETEAYNQDDAASHSYKGMTPRTEVMFGPAGHVYVYFTYGMHWCMNIVTGPKGRGEAVLIRSIVPEAGLEIMHERRHTAKTSELTNGPAKLCQALGITGQDKGLRLGQRIRLEAPDQNAKFVVKASQRIGIKRDTHRLWRFTGELVT